MNKFLLIIFLFLCSCGERKTAEETVAESLEEDEVTRVKENDPKMEAAIAEARKTVDALLKVMSSKDEAIKSISIKVPLEDGDEVEHVWLGNVEFKAGNFIGNIANDLKVVKNFKMGQSVTYGKDEITDWMYIKDDVVYGNVTLKAMFHVMDPEEVKVLKKMMGWGDE